jgi:hypothetical protein
MNTDEKDTADKNNISGNLCISVSSVVRKTVTREPQMNTDEKDAADENNQR